MNSTIDRRTFLRGAALAAGSLALAPVPSVPWTPTVEAAMRISWKPALKWVGKLGLDIGATALKDTAVEWLKPRIKAAIAGNDAVREARRNGYTSLRNSRVNQFTDMFFFGIEEPETQDAYAPIIFPSNGGYNYTPLYGPALVGLAQATPDILRIYRRHGWTPNDAGALLLPISHIQSSSSTLSWEWDWHANYWSRAGFVNLNYHVLADPTSTHFGLGNLTLDVTWRRTADGRNDQRALKKSYEAEWFV